MTDYWQKYKHFYDTSFGTWETLQEECDTYVGLGQSTEATCDTKQAEFESAMCSLQVAVLSACQAHKICWEVATADYNNLTNAVMSKASRRQVEYTSVLKIECYIRILNSDEKVTAENVTTCTDLDPDASHLEIDIPPLPLEDQCDTSLVDELPCDDVFTSKYDGMYGINACSACPPLPAHLTSDQAEKKEEGALPGTFKESCAATKLASDERVIFFLHDDPETDDVPDAAADIAAGFKKDNSAYIGNEALAQSTLTGLKICLEEPGMDACTEVCHEVKDNDFTYTGPGIPAEMTNNFQKVVIALSGQIDDGNTDNGVRGNFINTKLLGPDYCPDANSGSSPMKCWMCLSWGTGGAGGQIRQWSGDTANWHVWGFGVSMFREGRPDKPTEELMWGRPGTGYTCNGAKGPWDTFFMVAKGTFPEGI